MNIAFIGVGRVGSALASHLKDAGYHVILAARDTRSASIVALQERHPSIQAMDPAEAVADADVVFLAVPYPAHAEVLNACGQALNGKILVDCTNPVGAGLSHGLESRISGAETVQAEAPGARVVKAFTVYGFENFVDPAYPGYGDLRPAMPIAGDDGEAKRVVSELCGEIGWQAVDTGPLSNSLHLEHMTLLWIKMARVQRRGANFVYGLLER